MPSTRLGSDEQLELALDELAYLGSQLGQLSIVVSGPEQVSFHPKDGPDWLAKVVTYDAVGEAQAKQLVATGARDHKVVVANKISEPARDLLAAHGWSWLDRRIGAHIAGRRRDIEIRYIERGGAGARTGSDDVSAFVDLARPAADGPIRGRAGIAYAAALLCTPGEPPSFRSIADAVGMSPTAVSNAVKRLRAAGLVGPGNLPTLPDLFWTLAEVWRPVKVVAVASPPGPDSSQLGSHLNRLDQPGWVLGGDLAATELGAPIFSVENRPWLWVPTRVELRRAERAYGSASWPERSAVIAAPPTPLVCRWRRPPRSGGVPWPLPHPVFAALDLARDPGRGREILSQWSPQGADVVWS